MPSVDREASRDSIEERRKRNSTSFDHGRALTLSKAPMWDSSDPERAPPPLPLNPSSPKVTSRPNTSRAIQHAHAALTEKARESAYTINPLPRRIEGSPERDRPSSSGSAHTRTKSSVRDLSNLIEGGTRLSSSSPKSPEKYTSPEKYHSTERYSRPSTPHCNKEFLLEAPPEGATSYQDTSTPPSREKGRDSPASAPMTAVRPSLRRPHQQSILGENSPPQSATMLALQSMSSRKDQDNPLSNVTNGSTALTRAGNFDAISNQILSLTTICTSLQKEMSNLSRRSKDNATDLVSLKEATNSRDEDIRRSLRELVTNLSETSSRSSSSVGPLLIENNTHHISPNSKAMKHFSLPRLSSPNSFQKSIDLGRSPSPAATFGPESAASIALLEKILREMGTKEGQDQLLSRLTEVAERLARDGLSTSKKLDDLVRFIKENTESQALVARGGGNGNGMGPSRGRNFSVDEGERLQLDFESPVPEPLVLRHKGKENQASGGLGNDILNENLLKTIREIKDSVVHGGGLTAQVKARVWELRGEILGIGRDIGRKLEEAQSTNAQLANDAAKNNEMINRIVQSGLEEMKAHMDRVMQENRRKSSSSHVSRATSDGQEIFNAVKNAMLEIQAVQNENPAPSLNKEDVLEAVVDAWENYKPDIQVQNIGLEREELLATLKEGIREFMPQDETRGATRDEVFRAVVEGLKHIVPPKIETDASLSKDEIVDAVRDCLEDFEFPSAPPIPREDEITKDDIAAAVREGLSTFEFPVPPESNQALANPAVQRDDLFEAVQVGLSSLPALNTGVEEHISDRLREVLDTVRAEFQAVSEEAKQNVAAHGRDTEQLLDANRDGLEKLRADIESYVDRAADSTGKDEILDTLRENFNGLSEQIEVLISRGSEIPLDALKDEFEHLQHTMATSIVRGSPGADKDEIIEVFKQGIEGLRADIERPRDSNESVLSGTGEILDALHDGLDALRSEVDRIANRPAEPIDMTLNTEILETLKAGLEGLRADMDQLREMKAENQERSLAAITGGAVVPAVVPEAAESLKRDDLKDLQVAIQQLQIKVEAMEVLPPPTELSSSLGREDIAEVEELIRNVQASVADIQQREKAADEDTVKKEDFVAIETLLRNVKARIEELDLEHAVKKDDLSAIDAITQETHAGVSELLTQVEDVARKEDIGEMSTLVKELFNGLGELKEKIAQEAESGEKASKTDIEAVEAVVLDVKAQIEQVVLTDIAALASKDDMKNLGTLMKEFKDRTEVHAESNVVAFEERQAETVGVGERVSEVQSFLKEFREVLHEKLDREAISVEALGKFLEGLGETIGQNATTSAEDIKEVLETVKSEFEKSNAGVVGAKLESDDQFRQTWAKFDEKFDEMFSELAAKHDEAQAAAEERAKAGEERSAETAATMLSTKTVAEELKLFIDSLGSTLAESVEKMDASSRTVFTRVEDTFNRIEDAHNEAKTEHELTREQVSKALTAVEGVSRNVTEYHPKILESIKDVLQIVGQHYEHSKTSSNAIQLKIADILPPEPPLLPEPPAVVEKYDDSEVHEKLNKLVDHMQAATKSYAQLEMLDQIQQKIMSTAAEVSAFVTSQTRLITEGHEDKQREVEAATIALEKRLTQKDHVEAEVIGLREEEDVLRESVRSLKAEQENLIRQKVSLSTSVSGLETALTIRREELHAIEARAEGLERRILESIIDHSRSLLVSKHKPAKDAMNLKRVPSHARGPNERVSSHATSTVGSEFSGTTKSSYSSGISQSTVNIAMASARPLHPSGSLNVPNAINNPANTSRRILSLNQITNNALNMNAAPAFKRSHSVKAPPGVALRKSSWGGTHSKRMVGSPKRVVGSLELNKENLAAVDDRHDDGSGEENGEAGDQASSDAGTTRRLSTSVIEERDEEEDDEKEDDEDDEYESAFSEGESSVQGAGSELTLYGHGE